MAGDVATPMEINEADEDMEILSKMSAVEIQQQYFENIMDCDWVKYERSNRKYLVQNIAFALFGPPSVEGDLRPSTDTATADLNADDIENTILQGYTSRQKEQVVKIYDKLCEQGKYSLNDMDILMSVILIVCCKPEPLKFFQMEPSNYWCDLHSRSDEVIIWCTAVFRVRKCFPSASGEISSCRLYIDEDARVYHSWDSYLENNTLPKCVLVVPKNGEYTTEEDDVRVRLTVVGAPSLGTRARVLSAADTTSTVTSLGALGVLGVAVFTPVAPALLVGAAAVTAATGVYGLVRSGLHLHDRQQHEQTISPTDPEARGSWINIAASSVGVTAGAATTLLSRSAAAGTNMTRTGIFLEKSVNILRHANLVTGGVGLANSLVHFVVKYHKHQEAPTSLELFQFAASTLFFANAVMSNRTARSIIEEAQTKTINEYRQTLRSNRHRKMFDKVSAETRRVGGSVAGNAEVIRSIRNIANKDQYFADVLRINKDANANNLRISMTSDGRVNLNAKHAFDPADLARLSKESRVDLFTKLGPADITVKNVQTKLITPSTVSRYIAEDEDRSTMVSIRPEDILRIGGLVVRISSYSAEQVQDMLHGLSKDLYSALMTVCMNIISQLVPDDIAKLRLMSSDKDLIVQVVEFVFNYLKEHRPLGEARETDNGIDVVLKEFFQDGCVRQDTIKSLLQKFSTYINDQTNEMHERYPNKREIICEVCKGTRYA